MRGFSLIEAIVYIALLGLFLAGAVLAAYQVAQSSGALGAKNVVQEEGNFVLRKIEWAMSGASDVTASAGKLVVDRYDSNQVTFERVGSQVRITEGGNTEWITTTNVDVTDFAVSEIPASGSAPKGVTAVSTINGVDFAITRYLRK